MITTPEQYRCIPMQETLSLISSKRLSASEDAWAQRMCIQRQRRKHCSTFLILMELSASHMRHGQD